MGSPPNVPARVVVKNVTPVVPATRTSTCSSEMSVMTENPERSSRSQCTRQPEPGVAVRALAVPRLLHHHRPRGARHGRGGQDPPPARDHRAGPRRPEEQRAGAPAVWEVQRQQRLVRPGRDGVQPHPRRRPPRRRSVHPRDHRHNPTDPDQRPGPRRILSTPADPAPAHGLWQTQSTELFTHSTSPPTEATP